MKIVQDRVPTEPGRMLVTPEDGSPAYYAYLTRADEPIKEGTPINKALFDDLQGFVDSVTTFNGSQIVTVTGNVTTTTTFQADGSIDTLRTEGSLREKTRLTFEENGIRKVIINE